MARPRQFEREEDLTRDLTAVKAAIKRLAPADRANVLRWLCLYFDDRGERYNTIKRRRVAIEGEEHWVVKISARK
jgi:hypothetical protein